MQRLEDMERITRQEFCDKMDEYIDRVDKEKIGFVICENDKPDIVLCPIDWFNIDSTSNGETLSFNIDKDIKSSAEDVLQQLGLDLETAIRVFVHQIAYTGSIPFPIKLPDWFPNPAIKRLTNKED